MRIPRLRPLRAAKEEPVTIGIALAGPRHYPEGTVSDSWIGDGTPQAGPLDIARALRLYGLACLLAGGLVFGVWLAAHLTQPG